MPLQYGAECKVQGFELRVLHAVLGPRQGTPIGAPSPYSGQEPFQRSFGARSLGFRLGGVQGLGSGCGFGFFLPFRLRVYMWRVRVWASGSRAQVFGSGFGFGHTSSTAGRHKLFSPRSSYLQARLWKVCLVRAPCRPAMGPDLENGPLLQSSPTL